MLAEFLTAISDQAVQAADPKSFTPDAEPSHVYFIRERDGSLTQRTAIPEPRNHIAGSLQPFAEFAHDNPKSEIWYSRRAVTLLLDGDTRRSKVTLPITLSPQVERLQALDKARQVFTQQQLVLLLRTAFANCNTADLLATIRSVRFINNATGGGEIKHGKTSIGRDIQQEVTGASAIPEQIDLNVPIFANGSLPYRQPICCAIDVDTANQTFALIPLPNAIEAAITSAEVQLGEAIENDVNPPPADSLSEANRKTPVYFGSVEA